MLYVGFVLAAIGAGMVLVLPTGELTRLDGLLSRVRSM